MFTDIVGSTELLAGLDARPAEQLRRAHFASLGEQISRHRGLLVKTLGDGVMATFDASADALQAAVSVQAGLLRQRSTNGRAVALRIGLSTGDVSTLDDDCFGLPVVEASRLCAAAVGGQTLLADSTRLTAPGAARLAEIGEMSLKGLPAPTRVWEALPSELDQQVRAVLADDSILVREGIAHVLEAAGIEVVAQAGDGETLIELVAEHRPDVAIVDMRMPPTHTIEGLEAAERIRTEHPSTSVMLLTQEPQRRYAARLLRASPTGVGYLLKEHVSDLDAFAEATRRVATGGTAFDPAVLPPGRTTTTQPAA
jgi:CheY-like chemotaxis protein